MGYAPLDDLEQQRWFAEACSVMNCPRYRPGAVIFDGKRDYPSLYQESVDALGRTLDAIAGSGAKPVIETHFNTIAPSASLAFNLVRQFEPARVGVNFDPANMIIEGREAWLMALQILGPYLDYVHAKNIVWRERDGVWRWEFAPMDAGQVDWVEVVGALRRVGYDGYIAFENFFEVPMTSRGYVGEDLTQHATKFRDIDSRLAADLAYFKNLLVSVNAPASA
jgi:sugar phosphate isomerase/epimerase